MLLIWKIITDMKELPPELTPSILIHMESSHYKKKSRSWAVKHLFSKQRIPRTFINQKFGPQCLKYCQLQKFEMYSRKCLL